MRNVLERASARETAARVAAGALAKEFLRALGVSVHSHVLRIASVEAPSRDDLSPEDFATVDESPVRCLDPDAEAAMVEEIDRLRKENESLGGIFEVRAFGLTPGLGSYASWEERLDSRLAQAVVSIQAVKGVSVGEAWDVAALPGSESHDEIFYSDERGWHRADEPRRRRRGRHDERRGPRGQGRDQADLDPDQAASLGRHGDQGARAGDARAHGFDGGPGRRRGGRGDGRAGARALLTARSSGATTSTT